MSQYFGIPASARPEHFEWMDTDDTDLARGEFVKISSNKPTAVSANDASDNIAGVVNDVRKNAAGNVTSVEVYFGPLLKAPIESGHTVPGVGDPVYCSAKNAVSGDGAGVATNAAGIGYARRTSGSAGSGWVLIECRWPHWANAPADAS